MKWIIVTGDSGGLGYGIVKNILENTGFGVIGLSRSVNENMNKLMNCYKERYLHIDYDLSNVEGIKELYSNQLKKIGHIVGLVNNSAFAYDDIVTNAKLENLEYMYKINVFSPIMLTKVVIRDMLLNGEGGSIVHISSICAHTGYKGLSMYASTKGALEAFSKTVSREWGSRDIRSNCVAPGFMETKISSTLSNEQKERIYKRNSLKTPTNLESVADMVVYLLTEKSKSITGQVLHVDNGTI